MSDKRVSEMTDDEIRAMAGASGPLAATLAEAKRIADGLQFACRLPDKTPDFTACGGPAAEAYWDYFTPPRISSLLGAVEAALKEHQPVNRGEDLEPICGTCHRGFWPCPTLKVIAAALAGKEAAGHE